ncbi:MAG: ABC transporter substrate-binding protein [Treponema sp.]|nr:ABC transporter substrate-binding protein [Treponema sp.]
MKLFYRTVLLFFAAFAFLAGCHDRGRGAESGGAKAPADAKAIAETKALAGEAQVPAGEARVPGRIISSTPSATEIILGLGLGDRIVAADKYSLELPGLPAGAREIDFFYPDPEAILGLDPDIIISGEHNVYGAGDDPFKVLGESGIRLLYIPTSRSIANIRQDVLTIAETLGAGARGAELAAAMEGEIEKVAEIGRRISADPSFKKKTVYLEISPFPNPVTMGRETFLNEMIGIIGAVNVFADKTGWIAAGAEAILERDPDVILTNVNFIDDPTGEIKARRGFAGIRAVREGRVYVIDTDSSSRPSQHITLALRQMALAVYPEEYASLKDR